MPSTRGVSGTPIGALIFAAGLLLTLAPGARGAPEPLLQTTTSWDGGQIAYPGGQAQVTSVLLRIEAGETPPFHCHPVPTMGYVLKGVLEVETQSGETAIFRPGQSVVEVMKTVHRGRAVEAPVEVVVFYAGSESLPTTVLPEDDPEHRYCAG